MDAQCTHTHTHSDQNMQEGSRRNCTIYVPHFASLASSADSWNRHSNKSRCSLFAILISTELFLLPVLDSVAGSPSPSPPTSFASTSPFMQFGNYFNYPTTPTYTRRVSPRTLTLCCFEFHLNICAYIIEYLYKYTSQFSYFHLVFFLHVHSLRTEIGLPLMLASSWKYNAKNSTCTHSYAEHWTWASIK